MNAKDPNSFDAIKARYEQLWANADESELSKLVKQTLDEGLKPIVDELLRISIHATNESVRLNAIKYVLDHRIFIPAKDIEDNWQEFMREMAGPKDSSTEEVIPPPDA